MAERTLVVDDHPLTRGALTALLEQNGFAVVGEASDGGEAIAKRLYISEHTVRSHVKNLLRKLGVCSRREALELLTAARAA